MIFYHGSTNPSLKLLEKHHSQDGYVYATTDKLVALTYAARKFPNLFTTQNDKIYFFELAPNLFEKMTKGKKGYIYTLKDNGFSPVIQQKQKCAHQNCYRTANDVQTLSQEEITDVYEELLKYQEQGKFVVYKYKNIPEELKNKMINDIVEYAKTLPKEEIEDTNNFWKVFLQNDKIKR